MTTTPPPPEPTDDEIRVRIAAEMGIHVCLGCFHEVDPECCHCGSPIDKHSFSDNHGPVPMGCTCGYEKADEMRATEPDCPNYLTDLNACAEFEKTLTYNQRPKYADELNKLTRDAYVTKEHWSGYTHHATARQRALAFLATINGETQ